MQSNQSLTVGYNKVVGVLTLMGGAINLILSAWVFLLGGFSAAIVTGIIITLVGILYLTRPYFTIEPNRLVLYNLLGMPVKQYTIELYSTVSIENNQLYINTNDNQTKVKVTKWLADGEDWQKLQQFGQVS